MTPGTLLGWSLLFGIGAAGLTKLAWTLLADVKPSWLMIKPWSCAVCLSGHGSILLALTTLGVKLAGPEVLLAIPAATAVSIMWLRLLAWIDADRVDGE